MPKEKTKKKKMYTILDPDYCHFYTGTLEEINEFLREFDITDVSDLTITEVKNTKPFGFDNELGVIL